MCVCVRERDRERDRDRQTDRQRGPRLQEMNYTKEDTQSSICMKRQELRRTGGCRLRRAINGSPDQHVQHLVVTSVTSPVRTLTVNPVADGVSCLTPSTRE